MILYDDITLYSMQAVQNFGLAVFIILADVIVENRGYLYLEIVFLIVLSFALIAGMPCHANGLEKCMQVRAHNTHNTHSHHQLKFYRCNSTIT